MLPSLFDSLLREYDTELINIDDSLVIVRTFMLGDVKHIRHVMREVQSDVIINALHDYREQLDAKSQRLADCLYRLSLPFKSIADDNKWMKNIPTRDIGSEKN